MLYYVSTPPPSPWRHSMKKILLASSLIVLGMSSAFAADGTITINGLVTDNTCVVTTPEGGDLTVTLPTVSQTSLATAGTTAGRTPFTLGLSNCKAGDVVGTYFEPGATVDFATGLLNNAGDAKNVKVQLVGDNNSPIRVLAGPQTNSQFVTVADTSANLNYYAEYYATGAAEAGTVNTSVQYTIIYQ